MLRGAAANPEINQPFWCPWPSELKGYCLWPFIYLSIFFMKEYHFGVTV